jgi:hypothetical protein
MNNRKWKDSEYVAALKLYDNHKNEKGQFDCSRVKLHELPKGRSIYAVKSVLYKEYDIRTTGSAIASKRFSEVDSPSVMEQPKPSAPAKKAKKKPTVKSVPGKTTRRSLLWGLYTVEVKESL